MLVIRMQRQGRSGSAHYRIVVQDSRTSPTSGRVIAQLGSYNPHSKTVTLEKEAAQTFLNNGAQPSGRVVVIFQGQGLSLPKWVAAPGKDKAKKLRNADKLRKNQPAEPEASKEAEAPAETEASGEAAPAAEEASVEETAAEAAETTDEQ